MCNCPKFNRHQVTFTKLRKLVAYWSKLTYATNRAGQLDECPGPRAVGSLAFEYRNTFLLVFHVSKLFITRQNCRAFWLLRLVYRLRKLTTLAFIVFEWLKRIEPNSTTLYDPRIRSESVHTWACTETFPGGTMSILLIFFWLLTMQCKWTFTKRFTLSTSLVCAGWTSVLNLLSEMLSTLQPS